MSDRVDAQMLADWRINYNLVGRTPAEAMRWWHDHMDGKAPAGVVAALGLCINEIERLTAERDKAQSKYERQREATVNTYARVRRLIEALRVTGQHSNRWKLKYKSQVPSLKRTIRALCAERDELRRQLAEAEQDARRYRWLRGHADGDRWYLYYDDCGLDLLQGDALDAAIDAAMGASNE